MKLNILLGVILGLLFIVAYQIEQKEIADSKIRHNNKVYNIEINNIAKIKFDQFEILKHSNKFVIDSPRHLVDQDILTSLIKRLNSLSIIAEITDKAAIANFSSKVQIQFIYNDFNKSKDLVLKIGDFSVVSGNMQMAINDKIYIVLDKEVNEKLYSSESEKKLFLYQDLLKQISSASNYFMDKSISSLIEIDKIEMFEMNHHLNRNFIVDVKNNKTIPSLLNKFSLKQNLLEITKNWLNQISLQAILKQENFDRLKTTNELKQIDLSFVNFTFSSIDDPHEANFKEQMFYIELIGDKENLSFIKFKDLYYHIYFNDQKNFFLTNVQEFYNIIPFSDSVQTSNAGIKKNNLNHKIIEFRSYNYEKQIYNKMIELNINAINLSNEKKLFVNLKNEIEQKLNIKDGAYLSELLTNIFKSNREMVVNNDFKVINIWDESKIEGLISKFKIKYNKEELVLFLTNKSLIINNLKNDYYLETTLDMELVKNIIKSGSLNF